MTPPAVAATFHRPLRLPTRVVRLARVTVHVFSALSLTVLVFPWIGPPRRQAVIRKWSQQFLRMLNVDLRVHARHRHGVAGNVLIVANHVSWLDIVLLNALQPSRFVAKAEIGRWPLLGRLTASVGTLFIERERRRDTHVVNRHTVDALAQGDFVAVFPEGTTSDGTGLLKFHSSLFQPVVDAGGHVQPIAIRYRTPADEHTHVPAFVGDLTLMGSLWQIVGEHALVAELHLLPTLPAQSRHRRELSRAAAEAIRTVLDSRAPGREPGTAGDRRA